MPPAFGGFVFEHGVEMVHSYEAEVFFFSVDDGFKNAAGAADGAIGDEYGFTAEGVLQVVVVAEEADGIGFGFAVYGDADDEAVGVYFVIGGGGQYEGLWLFEHSVGRHFEIGHVNDCGKDDEWECQCPFLAPTNFYKADDYYCRKYAAKHPSPLV